jgi:hypothetical protein
MWAGRAREAVFALIAALATWLIAERLGAEAEEAVLWGLGALVVVWAGLHQLARRQEARQGFSSKSEVRDRQVVLSLYVPTEGWLEGAKCEVRRADRSWGLGPPTRHPVKGGIYPLRLVWRFPSEPADPEPGRYKA